MDKNYDTKVYVKRKPRTFTNRNSTHLNHFHKRKMRYLLNGFIFLFNVLIFLFNTFVELYLLLTKIQRQNLGSYYAYTKPFLHFQITLFSVKIPYQKSRTECLFHVICILHHINSLKHLLQCFYLLLRCFSFSFRLL